MCKNRMTCATALLILSACSNGTGSVAPNGFVNVPALRLAHGVTAPKGFKVRRFASGTSKQYNPDPIVVEGKYVYVAFQNATQPTGTGGNSTIVQYSLTGKQLQSIQVSGRCDGMRWNPATSVMWITVNEDANSSMYTWDPNKLGSLTHYAFSSANHGGGYDDLAFTGGKAFIAASNPKLNAAGINTGPALVGVTLSGSTAAVTPVLSGNASAKDLISGQTVTLNLTDPDSLTVAPNGDVLLVSQGDAELVWIHKAGGTGQTVTRLLVGTQVDDTVYATKRNGTFYAVDEAANHIYTIRGALVPGTIYTEAPSDSGVAGFIGSVSTSTGIITPLIVGFQSPSGLDFTTGKH